MASLLHQIPNMEAIPSPDCIDPNLKSMDMLSIDGNFDMVYHDQPGILASHSDLDVILDSITIPTHVRRDPSDRVWNPADQEANIQLLRRNSILADFPFPPLANPLDNNKTLFTNGPSEDSTLPAAKRRRRRRKAPLTEAQKEEKHRKFLERNRIAASKCREKKKSQIERLEDSKIALGRENEVLKAVLRDLGLEVRLLREAVMTHEACNHPDVVEWGEHNEDLSAALDSICESLAEEEHNEGNLNNDESLHAGRGVDSGRAMDDGRAVVNRSGANDGRDLDSSGSRKSSVDDSPFTLLFSEDGGGPGRSSASSSPASPHPPADALKEDVA